MTRLAILAATMPMAIALLASCEPLDPMARRQQKVLPYQPSQFYADGISMRPPPEGTVPAQMALVPAVATGLGPGGKPVERIPVPVVPELLETGKKRFDIICATCHGLLGDGNSPVALNMALRRPPSLQDDQYVGRPPGYFFQVITKGFGLMPSYAHQLPARERWAVVAYLRALQLSQHARLSDAPSDVRARLVMEPRP